MSRADFFVAAVNDDEETLQSLIRYAGSLDIRKSSNKDKIIHGFGAIHYAALLGREGALRFLLPHELLLKTSSLAVFKTPHYSKSAFQVAIQQDCLHIALAKAQWKSVDEILLFLQDNRNKMAEDNAEAKTQRYDLSESRDVTGMSHLDLLCKFPSSPEVLTLLENEILEKECVYREKQPNCLQIACYNGRPKTVEKLLEIARGKYEMRRELFLMVTAVGQFGETVFDIVKKDIDFELNECTKEDRDNCNEIALRLLQNALVYLEATPGHAKHLARFQKHYKKEGTVTLPEYDFEGKNFIGDDECFIINEEFFLPDGCKGRLII